MTLRSNDHSEAQSNYASPSTNVTVHPKLHFEIAIFTIMCAQIDEIVIVVCSYNALAMFIGRKIHPRGQHKQGLGAVWLQEILEWPLV